MRTVENEKFDISVQSDNETLAVYDKTLHGEVRIYVQKSEVDALIELLKKAKNELQYD